MVQLAERLLRTWALDAAAHARVLARTQPEWGSEVHAVAGGWLVLSGAGLYVNRVLGAGVGSELTDADVDVIVTRSRALRVRPAIEVTPATSASSVDLLRRRGFRHDIDADVTALVCLRPADATAVPDDVTVSRVTSPADLDLWKRTSAAGWGHVDDAARRASDAFAIAAHRIDGDGMMIARQVSDGVPVGCASTTVRDRVATLGGMSTIPSQRRRGVQAALIRRRLDLAVERGCDIAATTAASGSASERNLRRHGFEPTFTIATWSAV